DRRPPACLDRLVGQHHLRRRPRPGDDRDHLRDPSLRRASHGLGGYVRARGPPPWGPAPPPLLLGRGEGRGPPGRAPPRPRPSPWGFLSASLSPRARGGLMSLLIIWPQGIWLPEQGHSSASTPLGAGFSMLPLTVGFLLAGPVPGILPARYGPRLFATGGML